MKKKIAIGIGVLAFFSTIILNVSLNTKNENEKNVRIILVKSAQAQSECAGGIPAGECWDVACQSGGPLCVLGSYPNFEYVPGNWYTIQLCCHYH
jgi:hypothetical protein